MANAAPLQVLLFRHPDDETALSYQEGVLQAFQGGREAASYITTGDDLRIQLAVFQTAPGIFYANGVKADVLFFDNHDASPKAPSSARVRKRPTESLVIASPPNFHQPE